MCLMCFKHCDYVKLFQSETLIEQGHLKPVALTRPDPERSFHAQKSTEYRSDCEHGGEYH